MMRAGVAAALVAGSMATGCMVAQYEEVPSDRRRLSSGQEVTLVWPDEAAQATPTLFVEYISSSPTQLEAEARGVWAEIRPGAEQKSIHRVAVRPTVVERGLRWRERRPSFWRASTSTFWFGQAPDGRWTDGDPGVSSEEAPPNNEMQRTRPAQAMEPRR